MGQSDCHHSDVICNLTGTLTVTLKFDVTFKVCTSFSVWIDPYIFPPKSDFGDWWKGGGCAWEFERGEEAEKEVMWCEVDAVQICALHPNLCALSDQNPQPLCTNIYDVIIYLFPWQWARPDTWESYGTFSWPHCTESKNIQRFTDAHISCMKYRKSKTKHISYLYLRLFLVPSSRWSLWKDSQRPCWSLVVTPVFWRNLHIFSFNQWPFCMWLFVQKLHKI